MKLSLAVLSFICMLCGSVLAFSAGTFSVRRLSLLNADAQQDAFAAFADSLEEDKETSEIKDTQEEESWQERLELLLDPLTPLAQRQILMSELMASNEEIRISVTAALKDRKVRIKRKCIHTPICRY
jgi:hypothetical protein